MFFQAAIHPPAELPDMVVIVADDLHWRDVAAASTPALDALAAEGLTFEHFHALPNCSPSRVALLTGRYPRRMGIGDLVRSFGPPGPGNPELPLELVTLPELLKSRGYATCLVGKWHSGQSRGQERLGSRAEHDATLTGGYDHWLAGSPDNFTGEGGESYTSWVRVDDWQATGTETRYATEVQVEAAVDWWKRTAGPKFLVLSLNAPHPPLHVPPDELLNKPGLVDSSPTGRYLGMVQTVDWAVAAMREVLGPRDWLFFLGDNGTPPNLNGSGRRAKGTTFARGVEVPLLVCGPRVTQVGRSTPALAQITDLYATLAQIAGAPMPEGQRGGEDSRSLVPAFHLGAAWPGRPYAFAERYPNLGDPAVSVDDRMIRDARWKLRVVRNEPDLFGNPGPPHEWLYDLASDPDELAGRDALRQELDPEQTVAYRRLRHELGRLPPRLAE